MVTWCSFEELKNAVVMDSAGIRSTCFQMTKNNWSVWCLHLIIESAIFSSIYIVNTHVTVAVFVTPCLKSSCLRFKDVPIHWLQNPIHCLFLSCEQTRPSIESLDTRRSVPSLQTLCVYVPKNDIDRKNTKINCSNSCLAELRGKILYILSVWMFLTDTFNTYQIGRRSLTYGNYPWILYKDSARIAQ
jgi:hypothetical protein